MENFKVFMCALFMLFIGVTFFGAVVCMIGGGGFDIIKFTPIYAVVFVILVIMFIDLELYERKNKLN